MTESDNDRMIRKIQALLDKADRSDFGPERDTYRQKADELIVKYAIESYEMDQARAAAGQARQQSPIQRDLLVPLVRGDGRNANWSLISNITHAVGCRLIYREFANDDNDALCYRFTIIGFESDVRYVEMLYFSLRLQMLTMLFPKADAALPFDQNVYVLHEAGLKWEQIKDEMNNCRSQALVSDPKPIWREIAWHWKEHDGGSLRAAAKRWATKSGDTYHTVTNSENYRVSFADAFVQRIYSRLTNARTDAGSGKEIVLKSRLQEVIDMYENLMPKPEPIDETVKRPARRVAKARYRQYDYEAARRGRAAADRAVISDPGSGVSGKSTPKLER